jgi:hypothetical protein
VRRVVTVAAACAAVCLAAPARAEEVSLPTEPAALMLDGTASIPPGAPTAIRRLIAAGNRITGFPYEWGGGHGRLRDDGYDCSGAVSFALIKARLLNEVRTSRTFRDWGRPGPGEWLTVYARRGHVYLEVAGLRLEAMPGDEVRWSPPKRRHDRFVARHAPGF